MAHCLVIVHDSLSDPAVSCPCHEFADAAHNKGIALLCSGERSLRAGSSSSDGQTIGTLVGGIMNFVFVLSP